MFYGVIELAILPVSEFMVPASTSVRISLLQTRLQVRLCHGGNMGLHTANSPSSFFCGTFNKYSKKNSHQIIDYGKYSRAPKKIFGVSLAYFWRHTRLLWELGQIVPEYVHIPDNFASSFTRVLLPQSP